MNTIFDIYKYWYFYICMNTILSILSEMVIDTSLKFSAYTNIL